MKITLEDWAKRRYDPPPPIHTLRKWATSGELGPTVERVGKHFYVDEHAERESVLAAGGVSLVARVIAAERA